MNLRSLSLFACLAACAPLASAHPAALHRADALAAFLHPFSGVDHLLAMLLIGACAARAPYTPRILPPLVFSSALALGALAAAAGVVLPALEIALALSVVVLGPLAAGAARTSRVVTLLACAAAGALHGQAHGSELDGLLRTLTPWAFVLGSIALHTLGFLAATRLRTPRARDLLERSLRGSSLVGLWLLLSP